MNATAVGSVAIVMWSLLALLTASTGSVPPFQLLAMTMAIGGATGIATWPFRHVDMRSFRIPAQVWVTGILGLFGYHFFYYTALRNAPPAPASLVAFLWPMLIVLGSALLPGERLRWYHLLGAAMGFAGAAFLAMGGNWQERPGQTALGYLSALACALIWSTYSIVARRQRNASSDAVAIYCLASAVAAAICHLFFEETVWPASGIEYLAIAGLGLMPVGIAFYAWDHGVKHGNIQFLGAAAYFAPLLSTLLLVAAGLALPAAGLWVACLLIVTGAILASGGWRLRRNRMAGE